MWLRWIDRTGWPPGLQSTLCGRTLTPTSRCWRLRDHAIDTCLHSGWDWLRQSWAGYNSNNNIRFQIFYEFLFRWFLISILLQCTGVNQKHLKDFRLNCVRREWKQHGQNDKVTKCFKGKQRNKYYYVGGRSQERTTMLVLSFFLLTKTKSRTELKWERKQNEKENVKMTFCRFYRTMYYAHCVVLLS